MMEDMMLDKVIMKNYSPICYIGEELLLYHLQAFYLMNIDDYSVKKVCEIKFDDPRRWACFCTFGERASHIYVYCGIEVEGGAVVAFNRGIYFLDIKGRKVVKEKSFDIPDMRRPLNFYKISGVKGFEDMILYADYSFNQERRSMGIYCRTNKGTWDEIYKFPSNSIRHIHSIIEDKYRDRVIILTGDFGKECGIWEAYNNFSTVKLLMGGKQKYRACCARAYEEGIVIVTDSPFDQNYVYLLEENKEDGIHIREVSRIDGPVVFFTNHKDDIIFSTDVEYDERKGNGFRKFFSYQRGPGCKDWYVHIYKGNLKTGFKEIRKFKKDILPMVTFGFGNTVFPNGEIEEKFFYYPVNVKKYGSCLCEYIV